MAEAQEASGYVCVAGAFGNFPKKEAVRELQQAISQA